MTDTSSTIDCTITCSPTGSSDQSCGCAGVKKPRKAKTLKYLSGFIALCAICCAVPPALIALGLIGIASATYLTAGLEVALIALATLGIGYMLVQYLKKRR